MKNKLTTTLQSVIMLLLILAQTSFGAETNTGSIKGYVFTNDGSPLAQVTVAIKAISRATTTIADGSFTISHIKPGTYILSFSYVGVKSKERTVTVLANKTSVIDLNLSEKASQLKEVSINLPGTINDKQISLGKSDISYFDLPQSGGVVSTQMIRDQQVNHLGDAIRNVSGVTLTQTRGGVGETYTARGYSTGITGGASSVFRDGVLVNSAGFPEVSTLSTVEVLKGSSALLYGNVSGGLIINMVTKKPQFNYGGEVAMRYGSYDMFKPSLDVYGPITKNLALRVIGVYENDGSYRNHVYTGRKFINPSLLYNIGKKTSVLLQTDYMKESLTPDFGVGSIDTGRQIPRTVSRSQYINTAWAYSHMDQYSATFTVKHRFNQGLNLSFISSAQGTKIDSYQASLPSTVSPTGDWYRGLARANTKENDYTSQLNLNGKFTTGSINHQLLLGTDFQAVINYADTYTIAGLSTLKGVSYAVYDEINTINLDKYDARTDIPTATATINTQSPSYRFGYYGQDLISLTDNFKVLAGLRYTIQKTEQTYITDLTSTNVTRGTSATKFDKAFSPKLSLIYQPTGTTSVYAGYSNNFTVNTGIDVATGQNMSPSIIDQYDAGIKNQFFDGKISANVSIYRIVNHNLSVTSPVDLNGNANTSNTYKKFSGQTTSDGIEVDISGNLSKNFYFVTGYAYNHAYYSNTSGLFGSNLEGEPLVVNPANTANASVFYTFDGAKIKGFKLGASAFYTGFRYGGYNNTVGQTQKYNRLLPVDGFATLDLSAGYTYKKLSLLAAVTNVTNTMNYLIHDNYSITPIAPTQLMTTLSYKF
jgi:iron complex outermembrane receptor protein